MLRDGDENVVRRSEEDVEEAEVEAKVEVKAKRRGALEASSTCIVLWRVYSKQHKPSRERAFVRFSNVTGRESQKCSTSLGCFAYPSQPRHHGLPHHPREGQLGRRSRHLPPRGVGHCG
jgi:hypothetical protein